MPTSAQASVMHVIAGALLVISLTSCTKSVTGQFKLQPAENGYSSGFDVTQTKVEIKPVDILWVVDNSASMDPSQEKLKAGFDAFAKKFLSGNNDIQMGIITTDAYLSDRKFENALSKLSNSWAFNGSKISSADFFRTKDYKNISNLITKFTKRVVKGTGGFPEERSFDSVIQFLKDNESSSGNVLFRKGSYRIIVFLTDEEEQSIDSNRNGEDLNDPGKLYARPFYYIEKDQATADKKLPSYVTVNCEPQVVDGKTFAPTSACVRPEASLPVGSFKSQVDEFFHRLDGTADSDSARYGVVSIVTKDAATIEMLRKRSDDKDAANAQKEIKDAEAALKKATSQGRIASIKSYIAEQKAILAGNYTKDVVYKQCKRYLDLTDIMGAGSFAMDIGSTDYTEVLNKIGLQVELNSKQFSAQTRYSLDRAPVQGEQISVRWVSGDHTVELNSKQYQVSKNFIDLIDATMIQQMKNGDRIEVDYQPATVLPAAALEQSKS